MGTSSSKIHRYSERGQEVADGRVRWRSAISWENGQKTIFSKDKELTFIVSVLKKVLTYNNKIWRPNKGAVLSSCNLGESQLWINLTWRLLMVEESHTDIEACHWARNPSASSKFESNWFSCSHLWSYHLAKAAVKADFNMSLLSAPLPLHQQLAPPPPSPALSVEFRDEAPPWLS